MKGEFVDQLCDDSWLQDLVFMVDMAGHLNDLNLKLQGKYQLVISMAIEWWKLNKFSYLPRFQKFPQCSFEYFKTYENDFSLFSVPFSFYFKKADSNVQIELIDIQFETVLKNKFNEVGTLIIFPYEGKQDFSLIKTDNTTFILHPENSRVTKSGGRY
ncbi:hypothetical protein PR048_016457 [Dryococelus australis]|uniref:Uncharacterized protein n=1 Tax=Dryococelus australis TaxID=614101 RepID=A0ABQ9HJZ7_9NEOP|nr:hypothetical protein PR048_016457 [Dryococelus australis]